MIEKILVVDDDQSILELTNHTLQSLGCQIICMTDPVAALEYLKGEEVAVLLTDNNMPVMHGLELIERANTVSSETVKIIMSAFTDLSVALCAINQCQVFKFIPKPWEPAELLGTVKDALQRYRTLQSIRQENEDVLRSLAQTIELKDYYTRGHCDRVAAFAVQIAKDLNLSIDMQREIKYGSWLHDCGKIGVPEKILNANRKLTAEEYDLVKKHPEWGADVAQKANLSQTVINVILCHHEYFDGSGYPSGMSGEDIPIEAKIVSVADVFDALTSDRPYRKGLPLAKTIEILESMKGKELDPVLVELFIKNQQAASEKSDLQRGEITVPPYQHAQKTLTLEGDYSIAGVGEQMHSLLEYLAENDPKLASEVEGSRSYTINLERIQELDACGCQLLAVLVNTLSNQGIKTFSFELNDNQRQQIQLLGFGETIFAGEHL